MPLRRVTAAGLLFVVLAGLAFIALPGSVGAATTGLSLHIVGESPLLNGTTPVLVAGIWHQITINLSTPMNGGALTLEAILLGSSPASTANTYTWMRNEANNSWTDVLYGTFLRTDLSLDTGFHITFGVGVDAQAIPGRWTLSAIEGNVTVATMAIDVQAPRLAYGISAADFAFRVDPFSASIMTSVDSNQYLQITNEGNVPLGLRVGFDILSANLSLTNPATIAHVGSDGVYYVALTLGPTPPEIVNVNGMTAVFVDEVVPSAGASGLVPTFQQRFAVTVMVGRSGYDVQVLGNVAFQTLDTVSAAYGAVATWQVYLTGSQDISLNLTVSGARLLGLFAAGKELSIPAQLSLTPDSETVLTIQIEADQPGSGSVAFSLRLLGTGDTRSFATTLRVDGSPTSAPGVQSSALWVVGALAASGLFSFVALGQLRGRASRHPTTARDGGGRGGTAARSNRKADRSNGDGDHETSNGRRSPKP